MEKSAGGTVFKGESAAAKSHASLKLGQNI
jgi:hypothetical protein